MRKAFSFSILCAALLIGGTAAFAQESEERVVDEVVAQVNDGVISRGNKHGHHAKPHRHMKI